MKYALEFSPKLFVFIIILACTVGPASGNPGKDPCELKFSDTQKLGNSYNYFLTNEMFIHKAELFDKSFSLTPPTANCSAERKLELAEIERLSKSRSQDDNKLILSEVKMAEVRIGPYSVFDLFMEDYVFNEFDQDFRKFYGLMNSILFRQKVKFDVVRPIFLNKNISLMFKNPPHPAYPSGHSTQAQVFALFLSDLEPKRREIFLKDAQAIAHRRVMAGVHYDSDSKAGRELGTAIYKFLKKDPEFQDFFKRYKKYFEKNIKR